MNSSNAKYLLFLLVLTSCKKYDEGGLNTLAKRNLLSHEGKWSLSKYEVNSIDSTDFVFNSTNPALKQNFLEITYSSNQFYFLICNANLFSYAFSFEDKKTLLSGGRINGYTPLGDSLGNGEYVRSIFSPENKFTQWKIVKLKKREIILEYNSINRYLIVLNQNK